MNVAPPPHTHTRTHPQANRHPAMSGLYSRYLSGLVSAGVSRIVHFSSLGAASRFGSWGLAEWQDQDPATAPKQQVRWGGGQARGGWGRCVCVCVYVCVCVHKDE